jgi:DNA-binding transcriptional MerR regulator
VETNGVAPDRRANKSATAFRTTGEAAEELALSPHVLRFWESKFPQIRPLKRGGGRRYYRPEDIDLLRRIRQYLYHEGYTIRGVQRLLREGILSRSPLAADVAAPPSSCGPVPAAGAAPSQETLRTALDDVRRELLRVHNILAELLPR